MNEPLFYVHPCVPNLQNFQSSKIANLRWNNAVELVVINCPNHIMLILSWLLCSVLYLQGSQLTKVQNGHWEWAAQLIVTQINIYRMRLSGILDKRHVYVYHTIKSANVTPRIRDGSGERIVLHVTRDNKNKLHRFMLVVKIGHTCFATWVFDQKRSNHHSSY